MKPGDLLSRKLLLIRQLGEGGMGEVWLARNVRTQREFAIKVLLPTLASSPEAVRRFVQEARATGQIRHPSILEVFDAGKTNDGLPYLVMELLKGESLEQRLRSIGSLPGLEVCILLYQLASALAQAHAAGVVHRDLSGSNIFMSRSEDGSTETPKILDFGVSKILDGTPTRTIHGALLGSPAYMSPEQTEGAEGVDARTDVWSLGVLAYQALSGRYPFCGRTANAVMMGVLTKPHRPVLQVAPETDPELAELIESCLVKDRERRLGSMVELATRLHAIATRLTQQKEAAAKVDEAAAVPMPKRPAAMAFLRSRQGSALATGLFGIVVGVGASLWMSAHKAPEAPTPIAAGQPSACQPPHRPAPASAAPGTASPAAESVSPPEAVAQSTPGSSPSARDSRGGATVLPATSGAPNDVSLKVAAALISPAPVVSPGSSAGAPSHGTPAPVPSSQDALAWLRRSRGSR